MVASPEGFLCFPLTLSLAGHPWWSGVSQRSSFGAPSSAVELFWFVFIHPSMQEHFESEFLRAAWPLVFNDVLGHHCHLLSEVTTEQCDSPFAPVTSYCQRWLSQTRALAGRANSALICLWWGEEPRGSQRNPSYLSAPQVQFVRNIPWQANKKARPGFLHHSSAQPEQFICVA